jgi:hypothetical protein
MGREAKLRRVRKALRERAVEGAHLPGHVGEVYRIGKRMLRRHDNSMPILQPVEKLASPPLIPIDEPLTDFRGIDRSVDEERLVDQPAPPLTPELLQEAIDLARESLKG